MPNIDIVGLCWRCAQVITQDEDFCGTLVKEPVGCKDLTKEEWEQGLSKRPCVHQENCPLSVRA